MTRPLITVAELHPKSPAPDVRIFDCRYALMDPAHGRAQYDQSHIPGAIFVDMNRDLSTPHIPGKSGRHPLPAKADWIDTVRNWALTPDIHAVLYDDSSGASAARMWWMLKWIGHEKVCVLDGGWQAWQAAGLPVTAEVPPTLQRAPDHYSSLPSQATLLAADQIDGTTQLLIDARDPPRFRGEVEPIDPVAGHIPGAVCSPFTGNVQDGRFKSADLLREKFGIAVNSSKPVVCYCGSGITACHNILAMAVAGLPLPALYGGSWSEWIIDSSRAIATGE